MIKLASTLALLVGMSVPEIYPRGHKPQTHLERYNIKTGVEVFAKDMEEKGLGKHKVNLQL
jgi:hypothetical protein